IAIALALMGNTKPNKVKHLCIKDTVYVENKIYVDTGNIYMEAINHLKKYEGFRSTVYYDTDGSETIGYGHHILSGENFYFITEEEATELLKKDLDKRIKFVNEH